MRGIYLLEIIPENFENYCTIIDINKTNEISIELSKQKA